jgi:hypothetical protein
MSIEFSDKSVSAAEPLQIERLRECAGTLFSGAFTTVGIGLSCFVILWLQPPVDVRASATLEQLWMIALAAAVLGTFLSAVVLLWRAMRCWWIARASAFAGYTWTTMTGAVRGAAESGRLPVGKFHPGYALLALALGVLGPALWTFGVIGGWGSPGGGVLPTSEALLVVGPSLMCAVVSVVLGRDSPGSADRSYSVAPRRRNEFGSLLATIPVAAAILVGGVLTVAVGQSASVTIVTLYRTADARHATGTWLSQYVDGGREPEWAAIDSTIKAAARLEITTDAPDVGAARSLMAGWNAQSQPGWNLDGAEEIDWDWYWNYAGAKLSGYLALAWEHIPGPIPDSVQEHLSYIPPHPARRFWQDFTAAAELPPLWYVKAGLPGATSPWGVPFARAWHLRELAQITAYDASTALETGDTRAAEILARELIAAGGHLLREPWGYGHDIGADFVAKGAEILTYIGRAAGESKLTEQGKTLASAVELLRESVVSERYEIEVAGAEPDAELPLTLAGDRALHPLIRFESINSAVIGFCANPREILFGVDQARAESLEQAATLVSDLPRGDEWVDLNRRWLEEIRTTEPPPATNAGPQYAGPPDWVTKFRWKLEHGLGVDDVRQRLEYCGYYGL